MELYVQIKSFAISFLFGIIWGIFFNIFYNILFTKYKIINIISNLFFNILMFGLYFYLLYIINSGIIHLYLLFIMFISFLIYSRLFVKLRVKWNKFKL